MELALSWLKENANVISAMATLVMVSIWLFYSHLFYQEFKRQRNSLIFIHQTAGHNLKSGCLLINLSKEPIHILCVMLTVQTSTNRHVYKITDYHQRLPFNQDSHTQVTDILKQGPLLPGYFLTLGTFEEILQRVEPKTGDVARRKFPETLEHLEIRVVAMHGMHSSPVGAYRTFQVTTDKGDIEIRSTMLLPEQMSALWQRREVKGWLEECVRM